MDETHLEDKAEGMDTQTGAPRPLTLDMDHAPEASQTTGANDAVHSPQPSSIPASPRLQTQLPAAQQDSHPATSPIHATSPNPAKTVRRASSGTNLPQRPPSSPTQMRKPSRTSFGSAQAEEGNSGRDVTPKRSISNLISGLRDAHSKMELIEEPIPLTAAQLATEHFTRELGAHAHPESAAETLVILHDACYGHRYSRLKTTKSTLSMIVERPERIHASVLGASTAYVRLGGHHTGGKNVPHPTISDAAQPPFKIRRTDRAMDITSPYVTNVHGTAWMAELRDMANSAGEKVAAGAKELSRSATPTDPEKRKLHEGDLYLCSESLNAFQGALGGVADAVDAVFTPSSQTKRAFVAVRPPGHHCSADHPSGFCWLNNVHVGIEYAAQTYGLTHAAILDFDLHHGDGSQNITWQRNSKNNEKRLYAKANSKLKLGPDIGYYSLHDINSYPCEMGDDEKVQNASLCIDNAHGQSIWNVHLEEWKNEPEFWQLYEGKYRILLDKARRFLRHHTARLRAEGKVAPKSAVFISAGFDASEWEGSGMQRHKVNVPTEFYARFTRDVVEMAQEEGAACGGRVISVLEGGYSDRALCSGVLSHLSGLCATPLGPKSEVSGSAELDEMMKGLGINGATSTGRLRYDKSWWSAGNLTALEMKVNPPPPAQARKMRTGPQPTYATPTESFAYKVVDTDKFARSISGTTRESPKPARAPTPPPPEVDWVIATQELSRLLIPTNRQTMSCTPEQLAGVKVKKERTVDPSAMNAEDPTKPRQLRDRKAKTPAYASSSHSDELDSLRSVSRNSRRQTIADLPSSDPPESSHQRRASRRLSAGSTLSSMAGDLDPTPPPVPAVPTSAAASVPTTEGISKPPQAPGAAAGVQVKKTRAAPAKPKKVATSSAPVSPARTTKPPPAAPSGPAVSNNNDMDGLTSGMKKVTLKVGTKEEHDRKQKERVDAERRTRALKAAETRKANAAARKAAKEAPASGKPGAEQGVIAAKENTAPATGFQTELGMQSGMPIQTQAPYQPQIPIQPQMPTPSAASGPAGVMPPPVSLPVQEGSQQFGYASPSHAHPAPVSPGQLQQPQPPPPPQPQMMPRQPEMMAPPPPETLFTPPSQEQRFLPNPLSPTIEQQQQPPPIPDSASRQLLQETNMAYGTAPPMFFAPPATSASRPSSSHQLPVWSSTGPIPFGPTPSKNSVVQGAGNETQMESSNVNQAASETATAPGQFDAGTTPISTHGEHAPSAPSIWDVPETPKR